MSREELRIKDTDGPSSQVHLDAIFGQFQEKDPVLEFPKFHNVNPTKKGTGILSNVREERIMARRKRLEQRLARKEESGEYEETEGGDEELRGHGRMPSFAPVVESIKNLQKSAKTSEDTLQSYVRTVCQRRVHRRQAVHQHLDHLEKRIQTNKIQSSQRLAAKMAKYSDLSHKTLSLDELVLLLEKYRTYGKELVKSKQTFVEEMEDELKSIDDNFARMLKVFQKDIDGVRKKTTEFCTKLTGLFRREMYEVDKTFAGVENDYTRKLAVLLEKGHAELRAKDDAVTVQREDLMEEILGNMKILRTAKLDAYLDVKTVLDSDIVLMTEQLQNMRASFLVNAEKLDYNLDIIKLREEESMKTKNKQKRIITKIQDEVARATNELRAQEKKTKTKLAKHKLSYMEKTRGLIQMHQTYEQSVRKEWAMYRDCWISNELALRDTLRTLLLLDRFITEEVASCDWKPPSLWFLTHIGPIHAPRWRQINETWTHQLDQLKIHPHQLEMKLREEWQICWKILNLRSKRLAPFRNLSLVRRATGPLTESDLLTRSKQITFEPPPHILGPVLRWILDHLQFLNEDYTVDVMNQLNWRDRFCFQVQAFLNEFPEMNYDDLCELAVFFLRYSRGVSEKQAKNEPVQDGDVEEWFKSGAPEDVLNQRVQFSDAFSAVQAFFQHKRNKKVAEGNYDLVRSRGKGRDSSADKEYLDRYLNVFDIGKKVLEWEQLLYGIRKESKTSEKKLKLIGKTKLLQQRNAQLKGFVRVNIIGEGAKKDYARYIFPPLYNKMDQIAQELSLNISSRV